MLKLSKISSSGSEFLQRLQYCILRSAAVTGAKWCLSVLQLGTHFWDKINVLLMGLYFFHNCPSAQRQKAHCNSCIIIIALFGPVCYVYGNNLLPSSQMRNHDNLWKSKNTFSECIYFLFEIGCYQVIEMQLTVCFVSARTKYVKQFFYTCVMRACLYGSQGHWLPFKF